METVEKIECGKCEKAIEPKALEQWENDNYHRDCLRQFTSECARCGERENDDDTTEIDGSTWCSGCVSDYAVSCYECGDYMDESNGWEWEGDTYCRYHYDMLDEDNSGSITRRYSTKDLPQFMSEDYGSIMKSTRTFSAEIEAYYPDNKALRAVAESLPREVGISGDGSLNSNGIEMQTPKLKGANGQKTIEAMCKTLNDNEFHVDTSAGLHIHLDAKDLMPKKRTVDSSIVSLRSLFAFYIAYEDVLLSFLPPSRRGNRFCDSLSKSFHIKEVLEIASLDKLEQLWYRVKVKREIANIKKEHHHHSRYNGVNFHSLLSNGHLEIRYHSGTTNARKILEWANLHARIMDLAAPIWKERSDFSYRMMAVDWANVMEPQEPQEQQKRKAIYRAVCAIDKDALMRAMDIRNLSEKTEKLFEVLKLTESSKAYFRERQAAFTSDKADVNEGDNTTGVCAE